MYTRTGDDGSTGVLGGKRLPKYHPRLEAVGAVDEASAALGLARAVCQAPQTGSILMDIQHDLYAVMAELAAAPENVERYSLLEKSRLQWLETQSRCHLRVGPYSEGFHPAGGYTRWRHIGAGAHRLSVGLNAGLRNYWITVRSKIHFCSSI